MSHHKSNKHGQKAGNCCCRPGDCGTSIRRYFSSKEEISKLEDYSAELKKELEGVEERITDLGAK
ncbi:hypothetical protein ACFL47_11230 [Candidatus Latescibacterota bacterium]